MYEDCFARVEFRCGVLKKALCKDGKCPFYKSKKQYNEDIKKYPHRDSVQKKSKRKAVRKVGKRKANDG